MKYDQFKIGEKYIFICTNPDNTTQKDYAKINNMKIFIVKNKYAGNYYLFCPLNESDFYSITNPDYYKYLKPVTKLHSVFYEV